MTTLAFVGIVILNVIIIIMGIFFIILSIEKINESEPKERGIVRQYLKDKHDKRGI